jgi:hypothetical protein
VVAIPQKEYAWRILLKGAEQRRDGRLVRRLVSCVNKKALNPHNSAALYHMGQEQH